MTDPTDIPPAAVEAVHDVLCACDNDPDSPCSLIADSDIRSALAAALPHLGEQHTQWGVRWEYGDAVPEIETDQWADYDETPAPHTEETARAIVAEYSAATGVVHRTVYTTPWQEAE